MHKEILSSNQLDLLPLVKQFRREFYLVGGTAIALHIGHRRSIDFDLFKFKELKPNTILSKISKSNFSHRVTRRVSEQLNIIVHDVKFTFYQYPFEMQANCDFGGIIKLPELLDLAAMKAYALGRRSKWKDYVDLYFILKEYFSVQQIAERSNEIYGELFSSKLFRSQLSFFDDIDHSEQIEYLVPAVSEEEIKNFLIDKATAVDFL